MGPYRKNSGSLAGIELYTCPNSEMTVFPAYTNKTVSGNFRGPEFPQGFFGIQSMMDEVAFKLRMDPVEFIQKNMTRKFRDETPYTVYTLDECIRRGLETLDWKQKWHPPGADTGPIKRGVGVSFMAFRSGLGRSYATITVDAELGRVKVEKLLAIHDCGRIINPLTAESQIKGGAQMGIGMALHEDLLYDRRSGVPLTAGYYGARIATHRDAADVDVI